jgi:hypothetical protein
MNTHQVSLSAEQIDDNLVVDCVSIHINAFHIANFFHIPWSPSLLLSISGVPGPI